jgi:uncharacterized protein YjbI with pentapeptide repeats
MDKVRRSLRIKRVRALASTQVRTLPSTETSTERTKYDEINGDSDVNHEFKNLICNNFYRTPRIIKKDFSNSDFTNLSIDMLNIDDGNLTDSYICGGDDDEVDSYFNKIPTDTFQNAIFTNSTFKASTLQIYLIKSTDFTGVTFEDVDFSGSEFNDVKFIGATFTHVTFGDSTFTNVDFTRATFNNNVTFGRCATYNNLTLKDSTFSNIKIYYKPEYKDIIFKEVKEGITWINSNSDEPMNDDDYAAYEDDGWDGRGVCDTPYEEEGFG